MPVPSVNTGGAVASFEPRAAATKAAKSSFAGALAHAASTKASEKAEILDSKKVPKGETTKPVDGHRYADILSGPRNGMYLNTSGNERHGQAFVLVKRDGKEFHVYGTGKDRLVVCLKRKPESDAPQKAPETATPKTDTAPSAPTGAAAAPRA